MVIILYYKNYFQAQHSHLSQMLCLVFPLANSKVKQVLGRHPEIAPLGSFLWATWLQLIFPWGAAALSTLTVRGPSLLYSKPNVSRVSLLVLAVPQLVCSFRASIPAMFMNIPQEQNRWRRLPPGETAHTGETVVSMTHWVHFVFKFYYLRVIRL